VTPVSHHQTDTKPRPLLSHAHLRSRMVLEVRYLDSVARKTALSYCNLFSCQLPAIRTSLIPQTASTFSTNAIEAGYKALITPIFVPLHRPVMTLERRTPMREINFIEYIPGRCKFTLGIGFSFHECQLSLSVSSPLRCTRQTIRVPSK
jgi:hypothetical protein